MLHIIHSVTKAALEIQSTASIKVFRWESITTRPVKWIFRYILTWVITLHFSDITALFSKIQSLLQRMSQSGILIRYL